MPASFIAAISSKDATSTVYGSSKSGSEILPKVNPPKNDTRTLPGNSNESVFSPRWATWAGPTNEIRPRNSTSVNDSELKKSKSTDTRCPNRTARAVPPYNVNNVGTSTSFGQSSRWPTGKTSKWG